ncbi:MAG TPA: phosphatase PAP2 family protein [Terriglobia bacterium]|nr:phosphatase PAP2 family protein [Terriglobia bacterium]
MIHPQSMLSLISNGDQRLMRRVNRWRPPRWVRIWMILATRGGDGGLWYAMAIAVLVWGGPQRFRAVMATGIAVLTGIALFRVLKRLAHRDRPCTSFSHCWATLLPPDKFSFPSGHSITAFAVAMSLSSFYPGLLAGLIFLATSVALSRVMLGLHYLSDVVVGCGLGASLGYAAFLLLR